MKYLFVFAWLTLPASFLQAHEIEVLKPVLIGSVPAKARQYDQSTKEWVEVEGRRYGLMVYLKNVSTKPVTVATDGFSQASSRETADQSVVLDMPKMTLMDDGTLLVPPRENFRLVDLRPGEATGVKVEFKMTVPLERVTVTYHPKDFYDGRFGYWIGKAVSETLMIKPKDKVQ